MMLVLLAIVSLLVVVAPAWADTIYSYVSDTFRQVSGVYTTQDRITGSFTVADGFVPQFRYFGEPWAWVWTPGLLGWSWSDGHQTFTEANSAASFNTCSSVAGTIPSCWYLRVGSPVGSSGGAIISWADGSNDGSFRNDAGGLGPGDSGFVGIDGMNCCSWRGQRGTWSVQTVPEPSTVLLVGLALAWVVVLARRFTVVG